MGRAWPWSPDPAQTLPMTASTAHPSPPACQGGCHLLQLPSFSLGAANMGCLPSAWELLSRLASPGADPHVGQTSRARFYSTHQQTELEPAHGLRSNSPRGAPRESPPRCTAPCRAMQVNSGVLGAAGRLSLAGCRAPHPDWLSWLLRRRGSPEPATGAPARCCCGSSWLRRVLPAKYLVVFSQLEEEMRIALVSRTFAAKLCVCAWREGGAPLMPLGRARMVLGAQGAAARWPWLQGVAAQGNHAGLPASNQPLGGVGSGGISGQKVHQWRAQLQAFCTHELPGVRAVDSPGLAGSGFWSSPSKFLICAGVGWHGHDTGDALGAQQRAGEQQLSQE